MSFLSPVQMKAVRGKKQQFWLAWDPMEWMINRVQRGVVANVFQEFCMYVSCVSLLSVWYIIVHRCLSGDTVSQRRLYWRYGY